jgi:peptidoglycan hydrolase CwlO-like protein
MLDELKKLLGNKPEAAVVENLEELEGVKATLAAVQEELSTKLQELEGAIALLASANAEKATLESALAEALKSLAGAEEYNKVMAEKALAEKLAARKQMIVDVIGEAKADATFDAVKSLDDAAFESVVSAFAASLEIEADSPMFKEAGVSASADVNAVSKEATLLKNKYKK